MINWQGDWKGSSTHRDHHELPGHLRGEVATGLRRMLTRAKSRIDKRNSDADTSASVVSMLRHNLGKGGAGGMFGRTKSAVESPANAASPAAVVPDGGVDATEGAGEGNGGGRLSSPLVSFPAADRPFPAVGGPGGSPPTIVSAGSSTSTLPKPASSVDAAAGGEAAEDQWVFHQETSFVGGAFKTPAAVPAAAMEPVGALKGRCNLCGLDVYDTQPVTTLCVATLTTLCVATFYHRPNLPRGHWCGGVPGPHHCPLGTVCTLLFSFLFVSFHFLLSANIRGVLMVPCSDLQATSEGPRVGPLPTRGMRVNVPCLGEKYKLW